MSKRIVILIGFMLDGQGDVTLAKKLKEELRTKSPDLNINVVAAIYHTENSTGDRINHPESTLQQLEEFTIIDDQSDLSQIFKDGDLIIHVGCNLSYKIFNHLIACDVIEIGEAGDSAALGTCSILFTKPLGFGAAGMGFPFSSPEEVEQNKYQDPIDHSLFLLYLKKQSPINLEDIHKHLMSIDKKRHKMIFNVEQINSQNSVTTFFISKGWGLINHKTEEENESQIFRFAKGDKELTMEFLTKSMDKSTFCQKISHATNCGAIITDGPCTVFEAMSFASQIGDRANSMILFVPQHDATKFLCGELSIIFDSLNQGTIDEKKISYIEKQNKLIIIINDKSREIISRVTKGLNWDKLVLEIIKRANSDNELMSTYNNLLETRKSTLQEMIDNPKDFPSTDIKRQEYLPGNLSSQL